MAGETEGIMKNIFIFIRRYFNLLFFLLLQILSIILLVNYNRSHEAAFSNIANEVTGSINTQYSRVHDYFNLKEANRQLSEDNTRLRNMLGQNFEGPDTLRQVIIDSLVKDTTGRPRKYTWLTAKVVNNSVSDQTNYITLHRGIEQGVTKDMAVIGPQGVVGTVVDVSKNYSIVMSLLHRNSRVSAMMKNTKVIGSVEWDGKDPQYLTLKNIPRSTIIQKGDSVVTSTYSANFPSQVMVGTVHEIGADPSSNFFTIKLKTATNFFSLQ